MIISNIIGGLGNQIFQFSAGLALAESLETGYKLDTTGFLGYPLHNGFELNKVFNGPFSLAEEEETKKILGWQRSILTRRFLAKRELSFIRKKSLVVEPHFHYWNDFFQLENNSYLMGYWQSYKYFERIRPLIEKRLGFKNLLLNENGKLEHLINTSNSVSLHIRRGDYVTDKKNHSVHGLVDLSGYNNAIQYISQRVKNPKFFIFSDDIAWTKMNLKIPFESIFVEGNTKSDSHFDMQLMSLCKHNIIANSTFSWWGAWLNKNPNKIVTYPKVWFLDNKLNTKTMFPSDWVAISGEKI